MNKRIPIILAVLTVLCIPALSIFATTGQSAIPIWTDCRGAHTHGNVEAGGAIGQNTIVVSWNSPGSDWISDFGCKPYAFTFSEMTVYIASSGHTPVPTTVVCHSTSCSDGFALLIQYCAIPTKYGCSDWISKPYNLKYGDSVVIEVTVQYAGFENHFGSYTLSVTS